MEESIGLNGLMDMYTCKGSMHELTMMINNIIYFQQGYFGVFNFRPFEPGGEIGQLLTTAKISQITVSAIALHRLARALYYHPLIFFTYCPFHPDLSSNFCRYFDYFSTDLIETCTDLLNVFGRTLCQNFIKIGPQIKNFPVDLYSKISEKGARMLTCATFLSVVGFK